VSRAIHSGLLSRTVKWGQLTPAHDQKVLFYKETRGIVLELHWNGTTCLCIIVDKDGKLHTKPVDDLAIVDSPLASTKIPI
jgi:hypothetical protein